jgi:Fe-S-cluster containining protein
MARRSLPIVGNVNPASVRESSAKLLTRDLRRPVSRARATEAATDAAAWSDEMTTALLEIVPPDRPIACKAGCAHCCRLKVLVTAPEAIRIADWLEARFDPGALDALRAHVADTDNRTHGMTVQQRLEAKIPCPLLAGERCLVHEVRPLSCRGGNSYDAGACQQSLEHPDRPAPFAFYRPQVAINESLRMGMSAAATANSLDGALLELISALRTLLARPKAGDEWGAGRRDALAVARDAEFAKLAAAPKRGSPG